MNARHQGWIRKAFLLFTIHVIVLSVSVSNVNLKLDCHQATSDWHLCPNKLNKNRWYVSLIPPPMLPWLRHITHLKNKKYFQFVQDLLMINSLVLTHFFWWHLIYFPSRRGRNIYSVQCMTIVWWRRMSQIQNDC